MYDLDELYADEADWAEALVTDEFDLDLLDLAAPQRRVAAGRTPVPPNLRGVSPNISHWMAVADIYRRVRNWFPSARVRVDKDRREHGAPASKKRPDIQFRHPGRHRATHIEVDTSRANMERHIADSDVTRRGVFVLVDGNTGRVIEKQIFPAGSITPRIEGGELRRSDVFDEWDEAADYGIWDTARRWGCKARCAYDLQICKNGCGFDYNCNVNCARDFKNCEADCDRRYP